MFNINKYRIKKKKKKNERFKFNDLYLSFIDLFNSMSIL